MVLLVKSYFVLFVVILWCKLIYAIYFYFRICSLIENQPELIKKSDIKLVIFIPLLNETINFPKLVERFKKIVNTSHNLQIVFVTTNREKTVPFKKNTIDLVKEFISQGEKDNTKYLHINYPYINASLAEQLNFAIDQIYTSLKNSNQKTFFGFYNADSNINSETIELLLTLINNNPSQCIFQQSSTFLQNHNDLAGWRGIVLRANGLLQTRWTFLHEIPRFLKNSPNNYWLAHCVSHGLFIESSTLKKLGLFPVDSFGEDLYLGFIIRAHKFAILPIPILETSDTPSTIKAMFIQKYVWFLGPLGYWYYWARLKIKSPRIFKNNLLSIMSMTILGIAQSINWVLGGWSFVIFLISAVILHKFFIGLIISLGYLFITAFFSGKMHNKYTQEKKQKINNSQLLISSLLYPIMAIIHGIPPIFTILKYVQLSIFPKTYLRPKTENN